MGKSTEILALDLGTKTGWAVSGKPVLSGVFNLATKRFEGGGMRFVRFRNNLSDLRKEIGDIDLVLFEEVRRHLSTDSAHVYGGLMGTLTAWCEDLNIPYQGVPVGTIKKFATGKGNASKDDMIAAAVAAGYAPSDDNEADALHILHWGLNNFQNLRKSTKEDSPSFIDG